MKIGEKRTREKFIKREKPGRRQVQVIHGPFLTTLQEKQAVEIDLDSALEVIDELGRKLRSQPTLANLKDYKAAVRSFLKQAIGGTYEVSERRFIDRLGRRRLYVIVAKVDERLDELTRLVLDRQDSTLDLASKLDEIRGLLLDIVS
ncbi:MAG TPA: YaaR family protein [Limnochordia bacterium]|nr:YaaR family protein [Limnochordia bacterium]